MNSYIKDLGFWIHRSRFIFCTLTFLQNIGEKTMVLLLFEQTICNFYLTRRNACNGVNWAGLVLTCVPIVPMLQACSVFLSFLFLHLFFWCFLSFIFSFLLFISLFIFDPFQFFLFSLVKIHVLFLFLLWFRFSLTF